MFAKIIDSIPIRIIYGFIGAACWILVIATYIPGLRVDEPNPWNFPKPLPSEGNTPHGMLSRFLTYLGIPRVSRISSTATWLNMHHSLCFWVATALGCVALFKMNHGDSDVLGTQAATTLGILTLLLVEINSFPNWWLEVALVVVVLRAMEQSRNRSSSTGLWSLIGAAFTSVLMLLLDALVAAVYPIVVICNALFDSGSMLKNA